MSVPSWPDLRARLTAAIFDGGERRHWLAFRLGLTPQDNLQAAWESATDATRAQIDDQLCDLERRELGVRS